MVAKALDVKCIHVGEECGIVSDFEYGGAMWDSSYVTSDRPKMGRDLLEGLHPNDNGSEKMAKYIYKAIIDDYNN